MKAFPVVGLVHKPGNLLLLRTAAKCGEQTKHHMHFSTSLIKNLHFHMIQFSREFVGLTSPKWSHWIT